MKRERLGSRLGFILLSAGCAIGIGNVWKFPYMVGQNGGGAFVLLYLFFLAIMGIPALTIEFSLGRASQKSPVKIYKELTPDKKVWNIHGYMAMAGNYILMMFYTCVTGWMLQYFIKTATGEFEGADAAGISAIFNGMLNKPIPMIIFTFIVIVIGFTVNSIGVQKGLERITKYMMIALLVIMVILAINSIFLKGGVEGLKFYLVPDLNRMKEVGFGKVIVSAMTQAFFTLSLGIGSMAIFGSYLDKERSLLGEAVNVALLDTFVALVSGLIMFPACMAYGVDVNSGPPLIFETLPNIFNHLPMGRLWGSLFFVFMSFAALSTVFAVFENIISCTMDVTGWSRKKACLINGLAMMVLVLPCIFGYNIWSGFRPLGDGSTVLDLEDFIVSNILLPLGTLTFVLYSTHRFGWGWDNFMTEANEGKGLKVQKWMRWYMAFVLPVMILILFVYSLIDVLFL
ncbi:MAG: sodium-dependent transporter [Lachnospiraceae bacterium]|nr:sodium-dependent transporter [Lachnospiraceae bacterium]